MWQTTEMIRRLLVITSVVCAQKAEIEALLRSRKELIPKFVRLSFHDCVGGCDGCVDLDDPENAGLDVPIAALAPICNESRADCWALAGVTAAEVAGRKKYPFKTGRVDCDAAEGIGGPRRDMPTALDLTWFYDMFGLDRREVVALMGAHTLGGANASGYNGVWTTKPYVLDNEYYESLLNVWSQTPNGQWELTVPPHASLEKKKTKVGCPVLNLPGRGKPPPPPTPQCPGLFMLNVDVALAKDLHADDNGYVDCLWTDQPDYYDARPPCFDSPLEHYVRMYRDDNKKWLKHFKKAFLKVVEHF